MINDFKKIKDDCLNLIKTKEEKFNELILEIKDIKQREILIDAMNRAKENKISISEIQNLVNNFK